MITPITVLDVSQIAAFLATKHRSRLDEAPDPLHADTKIILLRGPKKQSPEAWKADVEQVDQPVLKEWKSASAMLTRIRNGAAPFFGGQVPDIGRAYIEQLRPGGKIDWNIETGAYAEAYVRLHLCLVPTPGAFLYSGTQSMCLPWGQLAVVEHRIWNSAMNFGNWPRTHLVVDVRRSDA